MLLTVPTAGVIRAAAGAVRVHIVVARYIDTRGVPTGAGCDGAVRGPSAANHFKELLVVDAAHAANKVVEC